MWSVITYPAARNSSSVLLKHSSPNLIETSHALYQVQVTLTGMALRSDERVPLLPVDRQAAAASYGTLSATAKLRQRLNYEALRRERDHAAQRAAQSSDWRTLAEEDVENVEGFYTCCRCWGECSRNYA